jgi:endogenous inhibitor of DNA gyrase (YacG/DUF329 family)
MRGYREVKKMRCAYCGEKIEDEPVWREDEPYCSKECADLATTEEEWEEEEEEEEEEEDEK